MLTDINLTLDTVLLCSMLSFIFFPEKRSRRSRAFITCFLRFCIIIRIFIWITVIINNIIEFMKKCSLILFILFLIFFLRAITRIGVAILLIIFCVDFFLHFIGIYWFFYILFQSEYYKYNLSQDIVTFYSPNQTLDIDKNI